MLRLLALLAIVVGFSAYAVYVAWGETLDDAAISFAYSKNLVHGHGLVLNPGAEPVEAYSNFLWVMVMVPVIGLGMDAIVVSKVLGLILSIGALLLLANAPAQARGGTPQWLELLAPALAALTLPFALWSVSGMENGLLSFLLVLSVVLTYREMRDDGALPWSALVLFGAAVTRPEGIVFFVAAVGHRTLLVLLGRRAWAQDARWLAAFALPFLAYHVWHYAYFGELVPNTYFAKADHRSIGRLFSYLTDRHDPGFLYLRSFVGDYWLLPVLPLTLLSIAGLRQLRTNSLPLLMVLAGGTSALFVGGDWMDYHRFLSPLIPLLFLCAQEGLRTAMRAVPPPQERASLQPLRVGLGAALAAALLAVVALGSAKEVEAAHNEPFGAPYSLIKAHTEELDQLAMRLGLEQASVLTPDIGAVAYTTDLDIVDLAGLGDAYIARHDSPAELADYVFGVRRPDIITLRGIWAVGSGLGGDPRLAADYATVRGGYNGQGVFLGGVFVRRDRVVFEGTCPRALPWDGDMAPAGETVTVAGPVVAETRPGTADDPAVLFLGVPGGRAVVISPLDREYFPVSPQLLYLGQHVCVTGTVGDYDGSPAVFLHAPKDVLISGEIAVADAEPSLDGAWVVTVDVEGNENRVPLAAAVRTPLPRQELIEYLAASGYRQVLIVPGSDAERIFREAASFSAQDLEPQHGAPDLALREVASGGYRWSWSLSPIAVERIRAPTFTVPADMDPSRPSLDFDVRFATGASVSAGTAVTLDVAHYGVDANGERGSIIDTVSSVTLDPGLEPGAPVMARISPAAEFLPGDEYQAVVIRLGDHEFDTYDGVIFVEDLRVLYWPKGMSALEGAGLLVYDLPR